MDPSEKFWVSYLKTMIDELAGIGIYSHRPTGLGRDEFKWNILVGIVFEVVL